MTMKRSNDKLYATCSPPYTKLNQLKNWLGRFPVRSYGAQTRKNEKSRVSRPGFIH
jgi:hypothetical protein